MGGCAFYYGREFSKTAPAMVQELGTLRHTLTDVNGLPMHSLVSLDPAPSRAPAVVLVHGSGLSGRYMVPTAGELTRDFRVYVPDLPGFGDSGKPAKVLDVSELADWLSDWMLAIRLERASLLGNSFGCQVIADLAARYPARVERAIIQGPTTPPEERSWFWQFVRWRQNQRFNPSSLGEVTIWASRQAEENPGRGDNLPGPATSLQQNRNPRYRRSPSQAWIIPA